MKTGDVIKGLIFDKIRDVIKESIFRRNNKFDFMGKFGFDFSSTLDFVYSTLSKKYSTDFVYSTLLKKHEDDILRQLRQKVGSNLWDYYNAGPIFKNDFLILSSDNTLKDFFNANSVAITFDESQKIEEIELDYGSTWRFKAFSWGLKRGGRRIRRHCHAVSKIKKMCNNAKSFSAHPSEHLELRDACILNFSNCVVTEIHSIKYNEFVIKFFKKEE